MKTILQSMLKSILPLGLVVMLSCSESYNIEIENRLMTLLEQKAYFELNSEYQMYKGEVSDKAKLLIEASLFNTFNKNKTSQARINALLGQENHELSDSIKAELRTIQADNYLKLFEYGKALETNTLILEKYSHVLDSSKIADLNTMSNIYRPLVDTRPQQVIIPSNEVVNIKRDKLGYINIATTVKGNNYDFIFDTGAGMSVIKKSFAQQLSLEILETSIDVKSATDKIVKSSLAVVDTLHIAGITVVNSVFLVMEDEMLEFPQVDFYPLAIIGFPIIEELGEFTISKEGKLKVMTPTEHTKWPNMRLESLSPRVFLYNGKDTLEYALDTGAKKSHFTKMYFDKYRNEIKQTGIVDTVTSYSAGGSQTAIAYKIAQIELFIGNRKGVLSNPSIYTEHSNTFEDVYGNLGQDLIAEFDYMTLNFRDMIIEFEIK